MTNSENDKLEHIIFDDGAERWVLPNKKVHQNKDMPAIISPHGTEIYYKNGKYYREFGPDTKYPNGHEVWNTNKNYPWHREDGAAMIETDGTREYYINGEEITYDKFRKQNKTRNP